MAIDPNFEQSREQVEEEDGVAVWGPVEPPEKQGIRGTHVAVDFDICLADGACLEDCPVDVFEWVDTPGTPSPSESEPDRRGPVYRLYALCRRLSRRRNRRRPRARESVIDRRTR